MPKRIDHQPGEKRGRLTYVADVAKMGKHRRARFDCDCGTVAEVEIRQWMSGDTVSCGCYGRERHTTHGQVVGGTLTPLYRSWRSMTTRCTPKFQAQRPTYAGVKRDPRWTTFEGFRDNPPHGRPFEPGLDLSRIGDLGDYSPENCRWVTRSENIREMIERRVIRLPDGRPAHEVAATNGIKKSTWHARVHRYGWDVERAVTEPAAPRG